VVPESLHSDGHEEEMNVIDSPATSIKDSVIASLDDMLSRSSDVYRIVIPNTS